MLNTEKYVFSDIIDISELQRLQDLFSDANEVASVITHPDGTPITKPSNFCSLCDIIRQTEKGRKNCFKSDALIGEHDDKSTKKHICLNGVLLDAGVHITVGNIHIANWLIGQVKTKTLDEEKLHELADNISADRNAFVDAYMKIPIIQEDKLDRITEMLFAFVTEISDKAFRNLQLKIETKRIKKAEKQLKKRNKVIKKQNKELTLMNSKLLMAKETAEESDRLKSAFLANMSHEIRTPMNGILGFTDLLKDPDLSGEEQNTYIDIINQSGNRLLDTVNDIIEISKIETGQIDINLNKVNLNKLLKYHFDFFSPEAEQKYLNLELQNRIPENCLIRTDESKLNSILTNLIKNAIKYSHSGTITLESAKLGTHIQFSVKDNGIGIPDNYKKAVFDRFVQAETGNKNINQGSGLGLSITKSYVEMLGGKIWIEDNEDKGSIFIFRIPSEA